MTDDNRTGDFSEPMMWPRYTGIPTFMRAPCAETLDEVDIGLIGVPFDGGVTNRTGARHGPREIRNQSSLMRRINQSTKVAPFDLCRDRSAAHDPRPLWPRPHRRRRGGGRPSVRSERQHRAGGRDDDVRDPVRGGGGSRRSIMNRVLLVPATLDVAAKRPLTHPPATELLPPASTSEPAARRTPLRIPSVESPAALCPCVGPPPRPPSDRTDEMQQHRTDYLLLTLNHDINLTPFGISGNFLHRISAIGNGW